MLGRRNEAFMKIYVEGIIMSSRGRAALEHVPQLDSVAADRLMGISAGRSHRTA